MSRRRAAWWMSLWLALAGVWPAGAGEGGDPAAGREKSTACLACHGALGVSDYYVWPHLAGQSAAYLGKQLRAFRAGERHDPWMSPMARALSDADIDDLAAWFASRPLPGGEAGAVIAEARSCQTCHAPERVAENPAWPVLDGQHAWYLAKQLRDFREGRRHDPVMAPLAQGLTDRAIEALAAFYARR